MRTGRRIEFAEALCELVGNHKPERRPRQAPVFGGKSSSRHCFAFGNGSWCLLFSATMTRTCQRIILFQRRFKRLASVKTLSPRRVATQMHRSGLGKKP